MIYLNYITNSCQPDKGRVSRVFKQPKTVWQIIKEQKVDMTMPVLCLINGTPTLRNKWGNIIADNSIVSLIMLPLGGGGGGSNPLKTVLTVALLVASILVAPSARRTVRFGVVLRRPVFPWPAEFLSTLLFQHLSLR